MIYVPWAAEFLLECSGAVLAYRRRIRILSALLGWRALMDVVTFALYVSRFHSNYAAVMWPGRAVQYAILYALGVQIAAKMIREYRPITQYVYMVLAVAGSIAAWAFVTAELWEHKFMRAEAVTSFLLLAVVLLGWIGRKKELEEPWQKITLGLSLAAFGNALCSLGSSYWSFTLQLYPIPAIAALLVWNWAARPPKKEPILLGEFRRELPIEIPEKKPPAGVYEWKQERVM